MFFVCEGLSLNQLLKGLSYAFNVNLQSGLLGHKHNVT